MAKDRLTIDDLRAALAQRKVAPVYLFCGSEDFLVEEATDLVIESVLAPEHRGFNLDVMYGGDADARDVASHASSFPMMADRRVVVVRDLDKLANKELLSPYIEQPSPSTSLILHSTKPDFRKKPYLIAKRASSIIWFEPIRDYHVAGWISKRLKQQGWDIEPEAVKILAAYVGTSLREIQNELNKLYVFIGKRRLITPDDIRAVVGVSKEYNVFELQNAIGAKNLARSTQVLSRMLDAGESPILLIVMLTRYFTTLWKLRDLQRHGVAGGELAAKVGVSPYFIKEYVAAADRFTLSEIEHSFETLVRADEQLKTSSVDPLQAMQNLIVILVRPNELVSA